MEQSKHSPTPWRVAERENHGGLNVRDADNHAVVEVWLRDEAAANAALIVAAVNSHAAQSALLAECREVLAEESRRYQAENNKIRARAIYALLARLDGGGK